MTISLETVTKYKQKVLRNKIDSISSAEWAFKCCIMWNVFQYHIKDLNHIIDNDDESDDKDGEDAILMLIMKMTTNDVDDDFILIKLMMMMMMTMKNIDDDDITLMTI
jgi:hypothetical protein